MSNLNSKVFKKGTSNPLSRALGSKLKLLKSSLIVCVCDKNGKSNNDSNGDIC